MAKKPEVSSVISGGKLPPQALDFEEAVLGAILLEKEALASVIDILKPQSFYKEAHQLVFQAALDLYVKSAPVELLTVTQQLRKSGKLYLAGGAYGITILTNKVAGTANIEYWARIVQQKYLAREIIRITGQYHNKAYDDETDVFELFDSIERELFELTRGTAKKRAQAIGEIIPTVLQEAESKRQFEDGVTGVPSGFHVIDRITSGWQRGEFIVLSARPSVGKSACALAFARNASIIGKKGVAMFSLEMSSSQLVQRLISAEIEIDALKLRNGRLDSYDWSQLYTKISALSESQLFIDDTPRISVIELKSKARKLVSEHNIELIIIDYLQLMGSGMPPNTPREQQVSFISQSLKSIAKELNIPIIALSSMSRDIEKRGGSKKPMLSDLREGGSIEFDSDVIMFLHRPEYYGIETDESGNSTKGLAEIIIAKNRGGSVGTVPIFFIEQYAKFVNSLEQKELFNNPLSPSALFEENNDMPF